MPEKLVLQHVVTEWEDKYQNSHSHVDIILPSGMHPTGLIHGNVEDNNSAPVVDMLMPSNCYDVRRILYHARYNGHYHDEHPK